jgi:outer membrane immunogenic protein
MRASAAGATTSFLLMALGSPVVAQDIVEPPFDWSGFYVGVTAGAFDGGLDADNLRIDGNLIVLDPPLMLDLDAPEIGVTAGANLQMGHFVLGVEADVNWLNGRAVDDRSGDPIAIVVAADLKQLATLRGRAGVAFDNILFFATAGVAVAQTDGNLSDIYRRGTYAYSDAQTFLGWVAGGGVEVGVTERVSLKAEALYQDLGKRTYTLNADPAAPYDLITADGALKGWTARVGLNFHF